jgi:hypothetical protein
MKIGRGKKAAFQAQQSVGKEQLAQKHRREVSVFCLQMLLVGKTSV